MRVLDVFKTDNCQEIRVKRKNEALLICSTLLLGSRVTSNILAKVTDGLLSIREAQQLIPKRLLLPLPHRIHGRGIIKRKVRCLSM